MKRPPLVEVHWVDAKSLGGWSTEVEAAALNVIDCFTLGHLIEKTKIYVKLAATTSFDRDKSDGVGDVIVIPRSMVRLIRRLKY